MKNTFKCKQDSRDILEVRTLDDGSGALVRIMSDSSYASVLVSRKQTRRLIRVLESTLKAEG